jgi:hypothetical protein
MSGRGVGAWLLHCADPRGSRQEPPRRMLDPAGAGELAVQAEAHGVLPAVLRNFPPFAGDPGDRAFAGAAADARARYRTARAFVLMLRGEHAALAAGAAGLPMAVIKGPVFARALYPEPELRTFTDIDVLVAPVAEPRLATLLATRGYELADDGTASVRNEWKWIKRDNPTLMIEVHTDVVHAPSLRASLSLTYDDLAEDTETPAGWCSAAALARLASASAALAWRSASRSALACVTGTRPNAICSITRRASSRAAASPILSTLPTV